MVRGATTGVTRATEMEGAGSLAWLSEPSRVAVSGGAGKRTGACCAGQQLPVRQSQQQHAARFACAPGATPATACAHTSRQPNRIAMVARTERSYAPGT